MAASGLKPKNAALDLRTTDFLQISKAAEPLARYTVAVVAVFVQTLLGIAGSSANRAISAAAPPLVATGERARRTLRTVRKYRTGRHVSNGVGAIASLALARTVVLVGPLVGAMLYEPIETAFFALGLQDMRLMLPALIVALGLLLQLYSHWGWLD